MLLRFKSVPVTIFTCFILVVIILSLNISTYYPVTNQQKIKGVHTDRAKSLHIEIILRILKNYISVYCEATVTSNTAMQQ